jgi:hypothetical protein
VVRPGWLDSKYITEEPGCSFLTKWTLRASPRFITNLSCLMAIRIFNPENSAGPHGTPYRATFYGSKMSIVAGTNKKYVVMGGQVLKDVVIDAKGAEVVVVETPETDLYSPRTVNLSDNQTAFHPGLQLYFSIGMEGDEAAASYPDIYHFVLACRATKSTKNYYLPRPAESARDIEENSIVPYNLVSGDRLPADPPGTTKSVVHKYMLMGLHILWVLDRAGLGRKEIEDVNGRPHVVSSGGHVFSLGDGAVANTSVMFLGLLVDYYGITSGIFGMDAQLSFTRDPEYRFLVYKYLRNVFVSFATKNREHSNVSETTGTMEILRICVGILSEYLG